MGVQPQTKGRSGRPFRRQRAAFRAKEKARNVECHICHGSEGPIDWGAGDKTRLGWTLDHIVPWSLLPEGDRRRWDSSNWASAHHVCNARKGNRFSGSGSRKPNVVKNVARPSGW